MYLDRFLRDWRIKMVKPYVGANDKVLDVGCFDATLFETLSTKPITQSIGIDPLLKKPLVNEHYRLVPGKFPDGIKEYSSCKFNCITMLAVLEHIPQEEQLQLSKACYEYLELCGRIIITVPSAFVDHILKVLRTLRLVEGMSFEEHYGFKVEAVPKIFDAKQFKLIKHKKFQLGLNNLFVFEKL